MSIVARDAFKRPTNVAAGGVGGGFLDDTASYAITDNHLRTAVAGYNTRILYRPVGEALANMGVSALIRGAATALLQARAVKASTNAYVAWIDSFATLMLGTLVGGALAGVSSVAIPGGAVSGALNDFFWMRIACTGSGAGGVTASLALRGTPATPLCSCSGTGATIASGVGAISTFDAGNFFVKALIVDDAPGVAPANPAFHLIGAGDSILAGTGPIPNALFNNLFDVTLDLLGLDFAGRNFAVAGQETSGTITALPSIIAEIQAAIAAGKRPVVVLETQSNDLGQHSPPLSVAAVWANQKIIIGACRGAGAIVILTTTLPREGWAGAAAFDVARFALRDLQIAGFRPAGAHAIADFAKSGSLGARQDTAITDWYLDQVHQTDGANLRVLGPVLASAVRAGIALADQTLIDVNVVSVEDGAIAPSAFSEAIALTGIDVSAYAATGIGTAQSTFPDIVQLVNAFPSNNLLANVPGGLAGATAYRPATGEFRVIDSAELSGSTWNLTLATPFSTDLDLFEQIWVFGAVGGGSTGSGDTPIDHNGGAGVTVNGVASATDIMRFTVGGTGADDVEVVAYLKADYDAGLRGPANRQGTTMTGTDGRWVAPLMLDAGTYTILGSKTGYQVEVETVVVP